MYKSESLQKMRHVFMKRKKLTAITLMLAAVAATSVVGGIRLSGNIQASAASDTSRTMDTIFGATQTNDLIAEEVTEGTAQKKVTAFKLSNNEKVWLKRNLAFSWYEADSADANKGVAKHFNTTFAFKDFNFKEVTILMQSSSAWATEDDTTSNEVVIAPTANANELSVKINDGEAQTLAYTLGSKLTLELIPTDEDNDDNYGKMSVKLTNEATDAAINGTFENIGGRYAEFSLNSMHPLEFGVETDAEGATTKETTILFYSLNGQEFYLNEDTRIEDTIAPAFVVNQDIDGFLLGTAFSLDYQVIDVLQDSAMPTVKVKYYQYDPTVTEEKFEEATISSFTSHNFFHTVYQNGGKSTSVYDEIAKLYGTGEEYVAIRFVVGDSTFSGDSAAIYDLAWYLKTSKTITIDETTAAATGLRSSALQYVPINKNTSGPTYKLFKAPTDTSTENEKIDETKYQEYVDGYNAKLADAAEDVYAGSNSYIYLPSLKWLFEDNNGYNGLKMTISYKTETSSSPSTTSVTPSTAKIPVSQEGKYEFKIFASDSAGNPMQCYYEGKLVDVTSSNIWDIEDIPSFKFEIKNRGLKLSNSYAAESSRKESKVKDASYSFSDFKIVGATELREAYALYKVGSFEAYNNTVQDSQALKKADLSSIKYEDIATKLGSVITAEDGDYFKVYLNAYATLLAESKGVTPTAEQLKLITDQFERIGEQGDRVNGSEEHDAYEWNATSQSFKTVEEGEYFILADYYEGAAPTYRAVAYKVVVVESTTAILEGETDWLKNNQTSVILFAIAGVLLIAILILLLVKPSNESLEDIEEKEKAKKARKEEKKKAKANQEK